MINSFYRFLTVSICVFVYVACSDNEFPASPYPRIETLPVMNVTEEGALLQANIIESGNEPITDHGFVWGAGSDVRLETGDKVRLGPNSGTGQFEANARTGLSKGQTYYVKAFASTASYVVYGKPVTFTSKGGTAPLIHSFIPAEGSFGDTITIEGKYFSALASNNTVKFGSFRSKVLASTDTTISCVVPYGIPDATTPIFVTVAEDETRSSVDFIFVVPSIEAFLPQTGTFGDIVTITGTHFSLLKENNTVKFGDHIAEVIDASESQLKVRVPSTVNLRENTISVTVNLQSSVSVDSFIMLPPSVGLISTTSGFIGSTLEITGDNFNPWAEGDTVILGGALATVVAATKTKLTITVPDGIYNAREFQIEVVVAEQSAFSQQKYTLQDAWLRKADIAPGTQFGRYSAAAFSIDGAGYVGLGSEVGNRFWRYDADANSWSEVAPYPGGERPDAACFVIGDKAYVGLGGGQDGKFWSYSPQDNTWRRIADFPNAADVSVGLAYNDKGYIVTSNETDNFWEYDPVLDTWNKKADYPGVALPYNYPDAGFELNGKLYVYSSDNSTAPNPFYEYDPNTGLWTQKASVYIEFSHGEVGFSTHGSGYVRGQLKMYKYDPASDSWYGHYQGPQGYRVYSIAFTMGDKVYFGGGHGHNDFWEFDPDYE